VGAAGNPDNRFVFAGLKTPAGVNLKKFGVQRSLEKVESQLLDSGIDFRPFHDTNNPSNINPTY
jgi:hypothetical protein